MVYTIENFKYDIEEILEICKNDIEAIKAGEKRQATIEQIEGTIIPEMEDLLEKIHSQTIPQKGNRWMLSAAYITRGWNWDIWSQDELVKKLPMLDDNYRNNLE
ncbi:MAG: hypothetical protein FWF33_03735 [Clostridiales bacterium]|nr:hypothetical protein [Clostridiales bacterium]